MRVIHSVHQYETAARLIVGTYEPILYKIYNLCTYAKLSSLISLVYSQASYKNSRIITSLFIVSDGFMKMPLGIVRQMSGLNTCIGKCNHGHNAFVIGIVKPTVSLTHKVFLIGKRIISKKIIQIIHTTIERNAVTKYMFVEIV